MTRISANGFEGGLAVRLKAARHGEGGGGVGKPGIPFPPPPSPCVPRLGGAPSPGTCPGMRVPAKEATARLPFAQGPEVNSVLLQGSLA